jgi:uncharacterized membrane protein YeaQ/YmgE (transglycosylase-associated protein family)
MLTQLIMWIIIGAIGGWLAGYIMTKNTAFNYMDVLLGMIGAVVGGFIVYNVLNITSNLLLNIAAAVIGSLLVAFIYKKATGKSLE